MRWRAFSFLLFSTVVDASIFGDGNSSNGVEDDRQTRAQSDYWPKEFNAVGKLKCAQKLKGSGILIELPEENLPGVLTAAHVLEGETLSGCSFALGNNQLREQSLSDVLKTGNIEASELPVRYEQDWLFVRLQAWPQWQTQALNIENIATGWSEGEFYFVAFSLVQNNLLVHSSCEAGLAEESMLIHGHDRLVWDNCDSTGGASGGALFVKNAGSLKLVAFRVGSLFEKSADLQAPGVGAVFGLDKHINVSRSIWDLMDY